MSEQASKHCSDCTRLAAGTDAVGSAEVMSGDPFAGIKTFSIFSHQPSNTHPPSFGPSVRRHPGILILSAVATVVKIAGHLLRLSFTSSPAAASAELLARFRGLAPLYHVRALHRWLPPSGGPSPVETPGAESIWCTFAHGFPTASGRNVGSADPSCCESWCLCVW